jgi:hypothetical protein
VEQKKSTNMLYKKSYFKNLIFPSLGRAPMLVYVRPSNEALLRARVPGAQDQRGCPSHPFYRGGSVSKKDGCLLPCIFPRPRVARAQMAGLVDLLPPVLSGPRRAFPNNNTLKSMRPNQAGSASSLS